MERIVQPDFKVKSMKSVACTYVEYGRHLCILHICVSECMLVWMPLKFPCSAGALKLALQTEHHLQKVASIQHRNRTLALTITTSILRELEPIVQSICEVMEELIDALHISALR